MSSVVSEELAHGTAGVRSKVLQWSSIRRRCAHYYRVLHRVGVRQSLHDLSHRRTLLTDSDVDAVQLGFLILALVEPLLVYDGVDCDRRLAADTVTTLILMTVLLSIVTPSPSCEL